jgi:hypothetical protein
VIRNRAKHGGDVLCKTKSCCVTTTYTMYVVLHVIIITIASKQ